ncbi:MAG: M1 family peptidase, partial [Mycobacterium sp.]
MKASAKAPKKSPPNISVIDEYLPKNGNPGYQVSCYELDLEYKVSINRLSGSATITAVALTEFQELTLDLSPALTVSKVSVNGKRAAQFSSRGGKLRIRLASKLATGAT